MDRANEPSDHLSPEDQRLLDALAEAGFDPEAAATTPEERARCERLVHLLALLHDYPVEDGDDTLEHATLARIDRHEDEHAARLSFGAQREEAAGARGRRIRVPDFISVAAVLLVVLGVTLPITRHVRQRSVDLACANNLRYVGYAMSSYAGDNEGALPMAVAGANFTWDTVANIMNLRPLVGGNYCEPGHLECPGAHDDGHCGYSYQCQVPGQRLAWGTAPRTTIVLGDRNPLVDPFWNGMYVNARTISFNHGGRGQNVLGSDGATLWLEEPVVGRGDNIWLPSGMSSLQPGAAPAAPDDVFLVH